MIRSHKIALDPNNKQTAALARNAGCARFAYNWALAEWIRQYELGLKPNEGALRRQLNSIKRAEFPWMLDSPKAVIQNAIMNLGRSFNNFFKKRSKYPKFKKKGIHDSFRPDDGPEKFKVEGLRVKLPKLGWIKLYEPLRFRGKLLSVSVSRTANRWYVSIAVELEETSITYKNQGVIGVDLGVNAFATLSNGDRVVGPKPLKAALKKLRHLNKSLSRKEKGSKNRQKAKKKLAKYHDRISRIRLDFLHKLTTDLVSRFNLIVIEDLNVKGMMKNRCLARLISDMGFFEFKRQLLYKAEQYGNTIFIADRWFPSSKTCSHCGSIHKDLKLLDRVFHCPNCFISIDRDLNASINLKNLALSSRAVACGEVIRPNPVVWGEAASMKQESTSNATKVAFGKY